MPVRVRGVSAGRDIRLSMNTASSTGGPASSMRPVALA